jgi:hypothetical protein
MDVRAFVLQVVHEQVRRHKVAIIAAEEVDMGPPILLLRPLPLRGDESQLIALVRPQKRVAQRVAHVQTHDPARVHSAATRGEASARIIDQVGLERHLVRVDASERDAQPADRQHGRRVGVHARGLHPVVEQVAVANGGSRLAQNVTRKVTAEILSKTSSTVFHVLCCR